MKCASAFTLVGALLATSAAGEVIGVKSCARLEPELSFCSTSKAWQLNRGTGTDGAHILKAGSISGRLQVSFIPMSADPRDDFAAFTAVANSQTTIPSRSLNVKGYPVLRALSL